MYTYIYICTCIHACSRSGSTLWFRRFRPRLEDRRLQGEN